MILSMTKVRTVGTRPTRRGLLSMEMIGLAVQSTSVEGSAATSGIGSAVGGLAMMGCV